MKTRVNTHTKRRVRIRKVATFVNGNYMRESGMANLTNPYLFRLPIKVHQDQAKGAENSKPDPMPKQHPWNWHQEDMAIIHVVLVIVEIAH